jgi:hypothetical protein
LGSLVVIGGLDWKRHHILISQATLALLFSRLTKTRWCGQHIKWTNFMLQRRRLCVNRAEWNKLRSTRGEVRPISISLAFDLEGLTHTLRTKLGSYNLRYSGA